METNALTDKIHQLIMEHYKNCPKPILPKMRFEQDLDGDSLEFVELVLKIERRLGIELPDKEAGLVETVGQLIALVQTTMSNPNPMDHDSQS